MGRKRYAPEQISTMLREAEVLLSQGTQVAEVCRKLGVGNGNLNSQGHGKQFSHGHGKQKSHGQGKWNSHSPGTPVRLEKTLQETE